MQNALTQHGGSLFSGVIYWPCASALAASEQAYGPTRPHLAVIIELWLEVLVNPQKEWDDDDDNAYKQSKERKAEGSEAETVDTGEDDGERLKPDVEEPCEQGQITSAG